VWLLGVLLLRQVVVVLLLLLLEGPVLLLQGVQQAVAVGPKPAAAA
jgi:hypothetical protein